MAQGHLRTARHHRDRRHRRHRRRGRPQPRGAVGGTRRHRTSPDRRARVVFRPGSEVPHHGQHPPRRPVSAVRGRRAGAAGANHRANGPHARDRDGGAWLHGRRQRPGPLRSRAAHAGAGPRDHCAGARPRLQARGAAQVSRGAPAARAAVRRRLLGEPRTVGRHHRRQGNAHLRRQHSGRRLGAVERRLHESAAPGAARHRLRGRHPGDARRSPALAGGDHRAAGSAGRPLRHRTRHPPRRHGDRHQGAGGVRGAGRRSPADGPSGTREAGAHRQAVAHQGHRGPALRRPGARRPASGPGVPRHRGAAGFLPGARHGRGARAVPAGRRVRRGRDVAVLADGASKGVYGEAAGEWTPADALGYSKMLALSGIFHKRAGQNAGDSGAAAEAKKS